MNYVVYDKATGFILRSGTCPEGEHELQSGEGEAVIEGQGHDELHMVVNGEIVERPEHLRTKLRQPTYAEQRALEYPPIGDQLDALWKGGEAADEMRRAVTAAKLKYPKEKS